MIEKIRRGLWRILGVDLNLIRLKLDFNLLKRDKNTIWGVGTYNNGAKVWRWTEAKLTIGKYCSIAHGVNFIVDEGYHKGSEITNYPFINNVTFDEKLFKIKNNIDQRMGITVGNDVWIGINAIILPGIKIGNGATIAAGALVANDVPDYAVVGGAPARLIKIKHSPEVIEKLNNIAWWDWPKEEIEARKKDFYLPVDQFIQKYLE